MASTAEAISAFRLLAIVNDADLERDLAMMTRMLDVTDREGKAPFTGKEEPAKVKNPLTGYVNYPRKIFTFATSRFAFTYFFVKNLFVSGNDGFPMRWRPSVRVWVPGPWFTWRHTFSSNSLPPHTLIKALPAVVLDAYETHATTSKRALASQVIFAGLKDALRRPDQLYDAIRQQPN